MAEILFLSGRDVSDWESIIIDYSDNGFLLVLNTYMTCIFDCVRVNRDFWFNNDSGTSISAARRRIIPKVTLLYESPTLVSKQQSKDIDPKYLTVWKLIAIFG
jgi:hypothetical protein